MSSINPKIYVCSDPTFKPTSDKIIEHLNDKIKNYTTADISSRGDFSVTVPMLGEIISEYDYNLGIVICGYGTYPPMILNRNKDIRATSCVNKEMTEMAVDFYNINILCLPTLLTLISKTDNIEIIDTFVNIKRNPTYTSRNFLLERL